MSAVAAEALAPRIPSYHEVAIQIERGVIAAKLRGLALQAGSNNAILEGCRENERDARALGNWAEVRHWTRQFRAADAERLALDAQIARLMDRLDELGGVEAVRV